VKSRIVTALFAVASLAAIALAGAAPIQYW
jgi:hypothetical protein